MRKKIDRRQAKTWAALRQALMALIRRKGFDAITVQEILDKADVGRSTFYAHCTGKVDLLRKSVRQLREELFAAHAKHAAGERTHAAPPPFAYSRFMLDHLDANRDLYYNVVHTRGGDIVLSEIRRLVADFAREDLASFGISPGVNAGERRAQRPRFGEEGAVADADLQDRSRRARGHRLQQPLPVLFPGSGRHREHGATVPPVRVACKPRAP